MRTAYYVAAILAVVPALATTTAYGHMPLKRLTDKNELFYVSPRLYQPNLRYLPPQELTTNDEAAYGVYGSMRLPVPLVPGFYVTADVDVLMGPHVSDAEYILSQREFGAYYMLPRNFSVGVKHSGHYLDHDYDSSQRVLWNAFLLGYDFSIPCSLAQADSSLEFYYFPPHNGFDVNPGLDFTERVIARYALDYSVTLERINDSPVYLAGRFFVPLGDSRPQTDYNHRTDLIGCFMQIRCGYRIDENLSIYTEFSDVYNLGGIVSSRELQESLSLGLVFAF